MKGLSAAFLVVQIGFLNAASAQSISESWIRLAASACGGGISVSTAGVLEAALLRQLKAIGAGVEGSLDITDLERLLNQFGASEKSAETKAYRECLLTLANMAIEASGLPPRDVVLESPISIAPLETIRRGDRFAIAPGDSVAIGDHALIFSLDAIAGEGRRPYIQYTFSNSETGEGKTYHAYQGAVVSFGERCSIVPYKIDVKDGFTSFLANC